MNAKELRIGNYLTCDGLKNPIKVSIIDTTETSTETNAKPIPLTEEWLLKFGFVAKSLYSNFILNEIEIASSVRFVKTNERNSFYLDGEIPEFMKIRIVNVHQLQNLYFALTGEELVVLDVFS